MINLIDVDGGFLNIRLDARHFVALFLKALCHNESYPIPYYQQVTLRTYPKRILFQTMMAQARCSIAS
ncbi:hypothetical protein AWP49_07910 [Escherichia coli]|nr:hypothetical protein AWP49_07910 [Escherichia coli]OKX75631.1 hypothetical protein AWP95_02350 [Escherichia coli]